MMNKSRNWIAVGAGLAVVAVALVIFVDPRHKPSFLMTEKDRALEAIAQELLDPDSAQFRNVFKHRNYWCGEVNGKNFFGAYTGFKQFYVSERIGGEYEVAIYDPGEYANLPDEIAQVFSEARRDLFGISCGEKFLTQ